jgi:gliding motility-associated-like protein
VVDGITIATTTSNSNTFSFTENSQVSVVLNCDDACALPSNSNTVDIEVAEVEADAGSDQMIAPGESTILNGSGTSGGTFSWSPSSSLSNGNIASPTATPNSSTTYLLTVTANGCTATDEVTVLVTNLVIAPNTFTPNGDGTNETWQILRIENYPNCEVNIFDRWGQKVYKTVGYSNSNPWDGTNGGLKLPASTYYYVIDLNQGSNSDIYNGSVTIVY